MPVTGPYLEPSANKPGHSRPGDGAHNRYLIGRNIRNSMVGRWVRFAPARRLWTPLLQAPKARFGSQGRLRGRFAARTSRLRHIVAGTALPFYRFVVLSTSERRLGTVSAENSPSGLIGSRGHDQCID
jgi:hypothetical protein